MIRGSRWVDAIDPFVVMVAGTAAIGALPLTTAWATIAWIAAVLAVAFAVSVRTS